MKRNFSKPAPSRLVQTRRLLRVAAIVAASRTAFMTLDNVTVKLREQTGETWHERTVRRDLQALDSLGIVEKSERTGLYQWLGHSDTLTSVVMQSAERDDCVATPPSSALKALLSSLPNPWDMDAERHRVATSAARLAALADTGDRQYLKRQLVYRLGEGWTLQDIGQTVSTFDRFKPLSKLASDEFDSVRWEPTQPAASMDSRRQRASA